MIFSRILRPSLAAAALLAAMSVTAFSADLYKPAPAPVPVLGIPMPMMYELRGGVFAHDPSSPEQGSVDINGEFLVRLPIQQTTVPDWLIPRPHIGFTANTAGKTSHAYVGVSWTYDITQKIFVEASFGGAVHNGYTGNVPKRGENSLGCSPLFRESGSLGYRLTEHWSVMATVEHLSNAGICKQNRGLTNVGGRVGYSF